jgi:hypothetical protein
MIEHRDVWYRSRPIRVKGIKAYEDVGVLSIDDDRLTFSGNKHNVVLENARVVRVQRRGRDFINRWVVVEDDSGQQAMFADGSRLGWGGVLGGTTRLAHAIKDAQR